MAKVAGIETVDRKTIRGRLSSIPRLCSGYIVFEHGVLKERLPGIVDWIWRRWTTFIVATHSVFAIGYALVVGRIVGLEFEGDIWPTTSISLSVILIVIAIRARLEVKAIHSAIAEQFWSQLPGASGVPPTCFGRCSSSR